MLWGGILPLFRPEFKDREESAASSADLAVETGIPAP
jgi:hypothetical protein